MGHSDHQHSGQSWGASPWGNPSWGSQGGSANDLINTISNDIAKLVSDIFKLLQSHNCHPYPPPSDCHPPCYCPGTMIATPVGEVAVETLNVDDLVLTASGEVRPIRWIGRRQIDIRRHAAPDTVKPVRVRAGAFGVDLPRRDTSMSPGHSIFVEDALIPIRFLLNGTTIAQIADATSVTYYHVELDSHDILLADGLAAESYLDTGNRSDFENGGALVSLHPSFATKDWVETYAPLLKSGPTVAKIKQRLIDRAATFGHGVTEDHDLHIVADGTVVNGVKDGNGYRFELPADVSDIRLVSRRWVPAHLSPASQDDRRLGVCVARLLIDQEDVALSSLASGWNDFDVDADASHRWTDGSAALPAGARHVTVELCGAALYWADEAQADLRQAA